MDPMVSGADLRADWKVLTDDICQKVGYCFALFLSEKMSTPAEQLRVAVGRDACASADRPMRALVRGITAADADVFDCGPCTMPALSMTTFHPSTHCHGAVMISGTDQTGEAGQIRFFLRDASFAPEDAARLAEAVHAATVPERLVRRIDFLQAYEGEILKMIHTRLEDDAPRPLIGLHVVVDANGGVGAFYERLLSRLGVDTSGSIHLHSAEGRPVHAFNPEDPEALKDLTQAVQTSGADLGILFDPDCDQAAFVGPNGLALNRNRLIALIAVILLREKPGLTIATDSVTSSGVNRFITEWDGIHYRYKRGHRHLIDEAKRLNREGIDCPLAIETSGHAAFRENHFLDDGVYLATWLVLEAFECKRHGQTLGALIDDLQEPAERVEIRMPLRGENVRQSGQEVIEVVLSHTLENPQWTLAPDNREGVRITFNLGEGIDNAWFLLRNSLNDPVMALNAESDVPGGIACILGELYQLLSIAEALPLDLKPLESLLETL